MQSYGITILLLYALICVFDFLGLLALKKKKKKDKTRENIPCHPGEHPDYREKSIMKTRPQSQS